MLNGTGRPSSYNDITARPIGQALQHIDIGGFKEWVKGPCSPQNLAQQVTGRVISGTSRMQENLLAA